MADSPHIHNSTAHDPYARQKGLIDSTALIGAENEVAAKRPVGEGGRFTNRVAGVIGPRQSQAAEATPRQPGTA